MDDAGRLARAAADKAEAEARSAQAAAAKAEHEAAALAGEPARLKREAEARKAQADADKAAADARAAQVAGFVPDLSKVEGGTTDVKGDKAVFSSVLAHRALTTAAAELAEDVERHLVRDEPVLLTTDPDLVASDAPYVEVANGLAYLTAAADKLLSARPARPPKSAKSTAPAQAGIGPWATGAATPSASVAAAAAGVATAVAAAVPQLLSLVSPKRSVSSSAATVDDTAAVALVARELTRRNRPVRLDDFRLVPQGELFRREARLRERRSQLGELRATVEQERAAHDLARADEQARADQLTRQIDAPEAATTTDDRRRWEDERSLARHGRDDAADKAKDGSAELAAVDALLTSIDAFLVTIHAVPAGGDRSPIVLASLREGLRGQGGTSPEISRVLFLKAAAGSVDQLFSDRPMWLDDKLHTVASVSVSYWLVDVVTSNVLAAGVTSGSAELKVRIGESFRIDTGGTPSR